MKLEYDLITSEDAELLREFALRLVPVREEFCADWAAAWMIAMPQQPGLDLDAYRQMVRYIVETMVKNQLDAMIKGEIEKLYALQYRVNLGLARNQFRDGAVTLVSQRDLHGLSRAAQPVFQRWIKRVFADQPDKILPVQMAQERLGSQMAQIISEAYSEASEAHMLQVSGRLRDALDLAQQLASLSQALVQSLDTEPVLELAMQSAMKLLRTDGAALMLIDAGGTMLEMHGLAGADIGRVRQRVPVAGSIAGWVFRNDQPLHSDRLPDPTLYSGVERIRLGGPVDSLLIVPLRAAGRPIGTMAVGSTTPRSFSDGEAQVLQTLADYAAIALTNARTHAAEREAKEHAEHADRQKSEFVAAVSHEIRSPLNAILGYTSLLREELAALANDEQLHFLDRLEQVARTTHRLTDDLLENARLDAGKLRLDIGRVEIEPLFDEIADGVRLLIEGRPIALELRKTSAPLAVRGDRERVRQILVNLTNNATKFTRAGTISLEACAKPASAEVDLHVRDTGLGIHPADLAHLFELFYRGRGEQAASGAGIGLFLSRQLALRMGGDIRAASEPGRGTCFTLTLPVA